MPITHIASLILFLAGAVHLLRVIFDWTFVIEGRSFPRWISLLAGLILWLVGWKLYKHHC